MKRGNLVLSLVLISILVISGCTQESPVYGHKYYGKDKGPQFAESDLKNSLDKEEIEKDEESENQLDIIILSNIILGTQESNPAGDLNQDGSINVIDMPNSANSEITFQNLVDLKKSDDNSYYLAKGSYKLLITVNNNSIEKEFKIK